MSAPILKTARLTLRPLVASDGPAVFAMMSDPEVMRFWDWPAFDDPGVVDGIISGQLGQMRDGQACYWSVCGTINGEVLGVCDLSEIDTHHWRAEIGFLFARRHWGKGYAAEALERIIAYAFGPMAIERLWARYHAGNTASKALLTRLGFAYEGTLKGHVLRDGERRDCEIWGRLR